MTTMHGSLECEDALIKRAGFLLDNRGGKPALTIYSNYSKQEMNFSTNRG